MELLMLLVGTCIALGLREAWPYIVDLSSVRVLRSRIVQIGQERDALRSRIVQIGQERDALTREIERHRKEFEGALRRQAESAQNLYRERGEGLRLAYKWCYEHGAPADLLSDMQDAFHGIAIRDRKAEEFETPPDSPIPNETVSRDSVNLPLES